VALREELERLRRDAPVTTLALGIAGGFALLDLARGVSSFVEGLLTNQSHSDGFPGSLLAGTSGGLSWQVGHRVLTFDRLLSGLIELAVVATAAILIARRPRELPPPE
jgi:hypothetical protein